MTRSRSAHFWHWPRQLASQVLQQNLLWSVVWVVLICLVAFFWRLASTGLVDETEPLFAEAARQMYETGDWVTPYFNGVTRFDKPPLIYWLMAIAFHIFGVSEWAVRLPSAVSGAALVGLGFYTLRRYGFARPEWARAYQPGTSHMTLGYPARTSQRNLFWSAMIGAALMALHPETIVWARIGVSDMLLTGCMGTALLAFFLGYAQPKFPLRQRNWYLTSYGLMGLAVLAKGPVGIVIPGLILLCFLLYVGELRIIWQEMHLLKGTVLFLTITVPWYILVVLANGQTYIDSFFGYHNFDRFTSVVNGHAAPWYFYFLVVAVGFLPWSPYLPFAMARMTPWHWRMWQRQPRHAQLGIFALVWFSVIFGFFTVAVTKLPSYVLPLMPAAAILVSMAWSDRLCTHDQPSRKRFGRWLSDGLSLGMLVVLAWATWYSPNWMGDDPAMPDLPNLVRESGVMLRAAWIWGGAAVLGMGLLIRRQGRWLWSVQLAAFVAFTLFSLLPAYQLADQVRQEPLRRIAQTAIAAKSPTEQLYMVGFMKPSLVFYTQQPVTYIEEPQEVREQIVRTQESSALVVGTPAEMTDINWPGTAQVLVDTATYQLVRLMAKV